MIALLPRRGSLRIMALLRDEPQRSNPYLWLALMVQIKTEMNHG